MVAGFDLLLAPRGAYGAYLAGQCCSGVGRGWHRSEGFRGSEARNLKEIRVPESEVLATPASRDALLPPLSNWTELP